MSRNLPAATCSSMNLTNRPYSDMLTKPRISCSAGSVMSGLGAEVPERTCTGLPHNSTMNGQDFDRIIRDAFAPFLGGMGFSMDTPSISGRNYHATFTGPRHVVSVSFEPGCDAQLVLVMRHDNGDLSALDDRTRTPRLSDLNRRYMPDVTTQERSACAAFVDSVVARDEHEKALLQAAHELRLVLPKYLADHGAASP